jgi:hypothetical protein
MRMSDMIQRRTLLSALPFILAAACARAQGSPQPDVQAGDMSGMSGQTKTDLTGGVGKVAWLAMAGTVRLTAGNANVRPATLKRAIKLNADGTSARLFDIWQIAGFPASAGASLTLGAGQSDTGPNDAGTDSVWIDRSFTHAAMQRPVELSRLSREGARVMAIDATQIWLVEGGIAATAPVLNGADLAAFEAWQAD